MEFQLEDALLDHIDDSIKPAPKRIIICCDGTWQSSVTNATNIPSNVTRLARYLSKVGRDEKGQEWQQLVYYDAGIGTGVSQLEADRQGGTGSGFVGKVIEAYNFIVLNYNPGDKIFCIGFSRGAYTARAVAGLVTDIGIVRPRDMQDFPELYRLYQAHKDSHAFRMSRVWREWIEGKRFFDRKQSIFQWEKRPHYSAPESTRWVEAVAVFDTVGSLGIPRVEGILGTVANLAGMLFPVEKAGFHNVALSPYIKNAYHAMALDEHRKPFSPTLWHYPGGGVAQTPKPRAPSAKLKEELKKLQDSDDATEAQLTAAWEDYVDAQMYEELKHSHSKLVQVWFPGVHINIGGGNDDLLTKKESDFEQIALITLHWMVEQLKDHLAFDDHFPLLAMADRFMLMKPVVDQLVLSNNKDHWLMKRINDAIKEQSKTGAKNGVTPDSMRSLAAEALKGWATAPIIDSFAGEMKASGSLYRSPGQYIEADLGPTNEFIHPTVQHRIEAHGEKYDPLPLKGFKRQMTKAADGTVQFEWVKGNVKVPEWRIDETYLLERSCISSKGAKDFIALLDRAYGPKPLKTEVAVR